MENAISDLDYEFIINWLLILTEFKDFQLIIPEMLRKKEKNTLYQLLDKLSLHGANINEKE